MSHAVELATFLASGSASGPGKINMLVYDDDTRSISVLLRLPRTVGKASEGLLRTAGIQERRLDCGRMNGTAKQGTDMPTHPPYPQLYRGRSDLDRGLDYRCDRRTDAKAAKLPLAKLNKQGEFVLPL